MVCLEEGLIVTSVTASETVKSDSSSLYKPPNCTGTCSGATCLNQPKKKMNYTTSLSISELNSSKSLGTHLKRMSADLEGPAKTNLLFVL